MPSASQLESRPALHQHASPRRHIYKIIFSIALIATAAAFIAPIANAQDLGEIARQERAKKQNNPAPPPTHIYTNEDMQRQQILTPKDKALFSATTQPNTTKPSQSTAQLASESTPAPAEVRVPKFTTTVSVQTLQPDPTIKVAAAQPAPQVPVAQIPLAEIATQNIVTPTTASAAPDETPLGDVARYYRLKKHESARANAQTVPGPANAPTAPASAEIIPNAIPLNQMPLGDVARYYRAKAREESQAQVQEVATIQTKPSATPVRATTPVSKYPLTLSTMPLASPKRTPTSAPSTSRTRIAPTPNHALALKRSLGRLVAPKPRVGGIRITSGDTLWQLAGKYLGSATRWPELLALNPTIQNPKRLQVGTKFVLSPST
jgi:nucleoid-associated protein YgaU